MASDSDEESSFHSADEGDSDTERNEDDRKRPIHKPKVAEPKPMAALLTTDESPIG